MKRTLIMAGAMYASAMAMWGMRGVDLRCEYLDNPICVQVPAGEGVRLSWIVDDNGRTGAMQRGYEVEIASSPDKLMCGNADVWRSGYVESGKSAIENVNAGKGSFLERWWRVRLTDERGNRGEWSQPSVWHTGVTDVADWHGARWIAMKPAGQWQREWKAQKEREIPEMSQSGPIRSYAGWNLWQIYDSVGNAYDAAPMFRREFHAGDNLRSATLYICGLGYFEATLNGKRIGDDVLNPAWTIFDEKALYSVYDVTEMLNQGGTNAIGVTLGRGQLNPICNDAWGFWKTRWVSEPKLVAMLRMVNADGEVAYLVTDDSWKVSESPTMFDDTRLGEVYDARREQPGWDCAGFNDSAWRKASPVDWPMEILEPQMLPPIRRDGALQPLRTINRGEGITLYDMGENIAGWAKVRVSGPRGARVLVEYCELPSDTTLVGNLHPARLRMSADVPDRHWGAFHDATSEVRQQNGYILRGEGAEEFECRFSYKGFQYVRVTADEGVRVEHLEGVPVHSSLRVAGTFSCSDSTVNRLQQIAVRTMLNNFMGIPTDCPHREKLGWTADGYFTAGAAMYNFDMAQFYRKWMRDLAGAQTPSGAMCTVAPSVGYDEGMSVSWPAALMYVPAEMFDFYADRSLLRELYRPMTLFCEHARTHERFDSPEMMAEVLGDWVSPADSILPQLRGSSILAPPEGVNTYGASSYFSILRHMQRIAPLAGHAPDSAFFAQRASEVRDEFNLHFFRPEENAFFGHLPTGYRPAPNAVALMEGIVPDEYQKDVADRLIAELAATGYKARTGFLGTRAMMRWLPTYDAESAWHFATQPHYPGWGYMVAQGATSMWEDWAACASVNHTPYCLISEYFFRHLAGISLSHTPDGEPQILIAPQFVRELEHAEGSYRSIYGLIESRWERRANDIALTVTIPANCTATLRLPGGDRIIPSGTHTFNITETQNNRP